MATTKKTNNKTELKITAAKGAKSKAAVASGSSAIASNKSAKSKAALAKAKPVANATVAATPKENPKSVGVPLWQRDDLTPIVEFRNVNKRFGDFTAVNDVSLKIFPGEFFALLGPSGCGKTTLLRMLAGFESPSSGQVLLDGKDLLGVPANKRPVNMMFQSYALFPHLTVEQNIAFGLKRANMEKDAIAERTHEMLRLVKMEQFSKRKPHQMSGGQRQRVALARALAKNPKLLLLDEPLGALDAKLRESTQFELVNIQEKLGTSFIIVTHDQEEAMTVATRIGVMNHGILAQVDTPADIYENPKSKFVADFIGDVNLLAGELKSSQNINGETMMGFVIDGQKHQFVARAQEGLRSGEKATLAIRPEKISISTSEPKDSINKVSGIIDEIAYIGNLSTYYVRLADGTRIKAQEANRRRIANREISWEDKVWLSWTAGGGVILPN